MLLLALAIAPTLAISIYIISRKTARPEPLPQLVICFILGMFTTVPALYLERYGHRLFPSNVFSIIASSFLVIALVEESLKFAVVRLYAFRLTTFDEPMDGILYSVMAGMGFAAVENLVYAQMHGYEVVFGRMLTTVPAHASFSAIMGYYLGKARFSKPPKQQKLLWKGLWLPVLFHGVYDSFILLTDNRWIRQYVSELLLITGAVFSLYIALRLGRRLLRMHQNTSERMMKQQERPVIRMAGIEELPLLTDLSRQWLDGYEDEKQLPHPAPDGFADLIASQMQHGRKFFILYFTDTPAGLASFSETEEGMIHLHQLFLLPRYRHQGGGRELLIRLEESVTGMGARGLILLLDPHDRSIGFFEKMGFRKTPMNQAMSPGRSEHRILLEKRLEPRPH